MPPLLLSFQTRRTGSGCTYALRRCRHNIVGVHRGRHANIDHAYDAAVGDQHACILAHDGQVLDRRPAADVQRGAMPRGRAEDRGRRLAGSVDRRVPTLCATAQSSDEERSAALLHRTQLRLPLTHPAAVVFTVELKKSAMPVS